MIESVREKYFEDLANKLFDLMSENGTDWKKPWESICDGTSHFNAVTGHVFTGWNPMWLALDSFFKGYDSKKWATFAQWRKVGGRVRKGSKATPLLVPVFGPRYEGEDGKMRSDLIGFKAINYFNIADVDGIEEELAEEPEEFEFVTAAELVETLHPNIKVGGNSAMYIPSQDVIRIPPMKRFKSENAYWATLLHELTHWTGHSSRLDRDKPSYAFEELVAEMGSVFLCGYTGVRLEPCEENAKYLNHWMKALKDDRSFLREAVSLSFSAANYVIKEYEAAGTAGAS